MIDEGRWFGVNKGIDYERKYGLKPRDEVFYEMYDLCGGEVFFRYYVSTGFVQTLDYYLEFEEELKNICLSIKDFDEQFSYDMYILPLFRNKKLKELGI